MRSRLRSASLGPLAPAVLNPEQGFSTLAFWGKLTSRAPRVPLRHPALGGSSGRFWISTSRFTIHSARPILFGRPPPRVSQKECGAQAASTAARRCASTRPVANSHLNQKVEDFFRRWEPPPPESGWRPRCRSRSRPIPQRPDSTPSWPASSPSVQPAHFRPKAGPWPKPVPIVIAFGWNPPFDPTDQIRPVGFATQRSSCARSRRVRGPT